MSSAQVGAVLRHIRQLAAVHGDDDLPDRRLLERFAACRDEAAFAALLRRHGPMVLGVCKSVLHDTHDAEDAFQAAFLLLAQKAGSIHRRGSVSGWLYRVAYHAALDAQVTAARRRANERRAVAMPPADPVLDLSLRELRAVLLEELGQVPEQYRAPLVLCGLEEKSLDEAARLLGWSRGAVKGKLERGRRLLRARLRRRGLELPAGLLATALALHSSSGRVSAALAESTLRAAVKAAGGALGGAVSAEVATLVQGASKIMFRSKAKMVILLVWALGVGAAGFAAAKHGAFAALPEGDQPRAGSLKPAAPGKPAPPARAGEEARGPVEVSGQVLGPEGRPFAGARLYLASRTPLGLQSEERATSGEDGRFRFRAPRPEATHPVQVLASAPGHAPDWVTIQGTAPAGGLTLRLTKGVSISGRVLDQDGRPVAGARVRVFSVSTYSGDALDAFLEEYRKGAYGVGAPAKGWGGPLPGRPEGLTTDAEGRFRLADLGRDWLVQCHIEGPAIQHTYFWAMTRPAQPVVRLGAPQKIFGATFDYLAAAARPIRGVVRDKATGKPLAGVRLSAEGTTHTTRANKDGRFEILGCPKSPRYRLSAVPADGQPYFSTEVEVAGARGLGPITADIDLARGAPVLVRVTDQSTGKPVAAAVVRYYPLRPNPSAALLSYREVEGASSARAAEDGSARLAAMPGPGVLAVECAPGHPYMPALVTAEELRELFKDKNVPLGTDEILFTEGAGGSPRGVVQRRFQALHLINPPARSGPLKYELTVQPGRVVTGTVTGPDGRPLAGATLNGAPMAAGGSFKVTHLNPRRAHELLFEHKAKKLGLFMALRGDAAGPLAVRLQPHGSVTGRVVDVDGLPLRDAVVHFCRVGSSDWEVNVKSGADGKFRADGLVAGMKYWATLNGAFPVYDSVTVDPGKVKDLGDAGEKRPGGG